MSENNLSQRIRDLRAKHGLTLEQVAQQVGVGKSTVRKWETGMIENMRRDKIAKLAAALHTTPAYLMGWDDDPEPPALLCEHSGYWDGSRLREERIHQGYSVIKICSLLDMPEEQYLQLESDKSEPTLKMLMRLADVLACSLDNLCHRMMRPIDGDLRHTKSESLLIKKYRALDDRGQAAVWNTLNHEYDSLPGEKDNYLSKEA